LLGGVTVEGIQNFVVTDAGGVVLTKNQNRVRFLHVHGLNLQKSALFFRDGLVRLAETKRLFGKQTHVHEQTIVGRKVPSLIVQEHAIRSQIHLGLDQICDDFDVLNL
jgi:hypothetical protein